MDDLLTAIYFQGGELNDLWCTWREPSRSLVDFGVAYTYTLTLADRAAPDDLVLTKTVGFTGFSPPTNPNLVVSWATDELQISPGTYMGLIEAKRTSDGKDRHFPFTLVLRRKPGPQSPA